MQVIGTATLGRDEVRPTHAPTTNLLAQPKDAWMGETALWHIDSFVPFAAQGEHGSW